MFTHLNDSQDYNQDKAVRRCRNKEKTIDASLSKGTPYARINFLGMLLSAQCCVHFEHVGNSTTSLMAHLAIYADTLQQTKETIEITQHQTILCSSTEIIFNVLNVKR
jgi:hypothetical protein